MSVGDGAVPPRVGLLFDHVACDEPALAQQLAGYEVHDFRDWRGCQGETLARCRSVDVLVTGKHTPTLPRELADDRGRLRYICHTRGVVKAYFARDLLRSGVVLTNWGDAARGIAELALALLLSQLRRVAALDRRCHGEDAALVWAEFPEQLDGFRVGIYGCGNIGRHMARLCAALGMDVAAYDPWAAEVPEGVRRCESLRELFATTWAVSIHCGLTALTTGSVSAEVLALLPRGGIVVNTARGPVVDEAALAREVAAGRLSAACDVVADEQDWSRSPLAPHRGAALLTGHGRHVPEPPPDAPTRRWKLPDFAVRNLQAWRAGAPLVNQVTLEQFDRMS